MNYFSDYQTVIILMMCIVTHKNQEKMKQIRYMYIYEINYTCMKC